MKKKFRIPLTAAISLVFLLTGCGSSKSSYDTAANQSYTESASYDSGWSEEAATEETFADMEYDDAEYADVTEGSGGDPSSAASAGANDLSNRKLIKNVSLSLETEDFDTMKSSMEESISSFGGYIEYSSFDAPQGTYRLRYYSITARIPAENLDEFVTVAGNLGTLTNKSENVQDVTLDYVDKTAYKESLQVEYDRVTELLEQADDLDQILALESKLSQLRYEINSYESQLRTYDNLISYSTVNIYISEVEYETAVSNTIGSRISSGFFSSLYAVRDFFVDLFVFLIANLPVLLVWAVILILVILLFRRMLKKRTTKKEAKLIGQQSHFMDHTPQNNGTSTSESQTKTPSSESDHKDTES